MEESQDMEEMDSGNVADRIMYYEVDDSETVHYLSLLDYFTRADAPAWAWYVACRRREHPIVCERSILLVWADDSAGNLICAHVLLVFEVQR